MKDIFKSLIIFILFISFTGCDNGEMIKVDPSFIVSFQRDGQVDALAGNTFYVLPKGSGEFLTLYDGTTGHVWGETGALGVSFDKADSLPVLYNNSGIFKLTLVATSSGNYGKENNRLVKTIEVNVVDERNTISNFFINAIPGTITAENEILFSLPDITTDFNFKALFKLTSPLAKVYVNNVEQHSDTTVNNFAQPVVYTVKSAQGTEKNYTVKITTFPASNDKKLLKFSLGTGTGGNGEIGIIDELNKTILLNANYGTNLTIASLVLESAYASKIYVNGKEYIAANASRTKNNLITTVKSIKVVAQNKTEVDYAITVVAQNPVSEFIFDGLIPAPVGIIDQVAKTISINVLKGTDITKLVAKWKGSVGSVKIGAVEQTNGVTINDFTIPKIYSFYKGTTLGDQYTVTVNVK